ncbi:MAG TPA: hypothetical protein VKH37_13695, partial [Ferruginibacter sp.]|nr:hypothetical protein [Ferruginibacter sp.]
KAVNIIEQHALWLKKVYLHPNSLDGYYSREEYIKQLDDDRRLLNQFSASSELLDKLLNE